jgi:hypothetical protein
MICGSVDSAIREVQIGRDYFAGLRVTKRNEATVLLTLTPLQTPTLTITLIPTLTLLQICFWTNLEGKSFDEMSFWG